MNRFIISPTESDAAEVEQSFGFCLQDLIVLGIEDFLNIVHGADNTVVLEGLGKGKTRLEEAIVDLKVKANLVMPEKCLFSAKRLLIQIVMDEKCPLLIDEMQSVTNFITEFESAVCVTWGVSRQILNEPYTVAIRIFASNIE